jgi:hypothetical protein
MEYFNPNAGGSIGFTKSPRLASRLNSALTLGTATALARGPRLSRSSLRTSVKVLAIVAVFAVSCARPKVTRLLATAAVGRGGLQTSTSRFGSFTQLNQHLLHLLQLLLGSLPVRTPTVLLLAGVDLEITARQVVGTVRSPSLRTFAFGLLGGFLGVGRIPFGALKARRVLVFTFTT